MPKHCNRKGYAPFDLVIVAILSVLWTACVAEPRCVSNGECPSNRCFEGNCVSSEDGQEDAAGVDVQDVSAPDVPNDIAAEDTPPGLDVEEVSAPDVPNDIAAEDAPQDLNVEEVSAPDVPDDGAITAASLHGTWQANFRRTYENREMTEEERDAAMAYIAMMQMSLTFGANGSILLSSMTMGESATETGWYEVLSVVGNTITIRATKTTTGSETPEVETLVVTFENHDQMIMTEGTAAESEEIYFDRAP